jgi:hypothetical protein
MRPHRSTALVLTLVTFSLVLCPGAEGQVGTASPAVATATHRQQLPADRAEACDGPTGDIAVQLCRARYDLAEAEQYVQDHAHGDDTVPAWLVALSIPALPGAVVGAVLAGTGAPCLADSSGGGAIGFGGGGGGGCVDRDEPWPLIGFLALVAGTALVGLITGIVWLGVNGTPFRRRDMLVRRIDALELRAARRRARRPRVDVGASHDAVLLTVQASFYT